MKIDAEKFTADVEAATGPGTPGVEIEEEKEEKEETKPAHAEHLGHHVDRLGGLVDKIESILEHGTETVAETVADDESPIPTKIPWTHR